jgi:hypothetical protein
MLLIVQDGQGNLQTVVVKGQEAVVDYSGTIAQNGQSQLLLAANSTRSGWFFQNNGQNPMTINEIAGSALTNSFVVAAFGGTFPPENFPLTTVQINVAGTMGDAYTVRAW